jgi:glutamate carboxypeptidase
MDKDLNVSSRTAQTVAAPSASLDWACEFLEDLVNIDSTTLNAAGVERVQQKVAGQLGELGFQIQWLTRAELPYGPLLKAEVPGTSGSFITLVSHADTVLSPQPFLRLNQTTASGSGVIDNKGGLTVALLGLRLFLTRKPIHRLRHGIRFVSSPNEEGGSVGFLETLRGCAEDSILALGFEPALEDGSIIEARRGNRWYHVRVIGKEAHAGRSYGEHVNAAHELASQIHQLQKLTHYKKQISVNVGALSGGRDKYNVICGHAEAKIDVRFANFKSRNRLHRKIQCILEQKRNISVCGKFVPETTWELADDCPPFAATRHSRKLVKQYLQILEQIEKHPVQAKSAGGSGDVNYLSREKVTVLDGFGPVGGAMHTAAEFVYLPSLWTRALAFSQFLESLQK